MAERFKSRLTTEQPTRPMRSFRNSMRMCPEQFRNGTLMSSFERPRGLSLFRWETFRPMEPRALIRRHTSTKPARPLTCMAGTKPQVFRAGAIASGGRITKGLCWINALLNSVNWTLHLPLRPRVFPAFPTVPAATLLPLERSIPSLTRLRPFLPRTLMRVTVQRPWPLPPNSRHRWLHCRARSATHSSTRSVSAQLPSITPVTSTRAIMPWWRIWACFMT